MYTMLRLMELGTALSIKLRRKEVTQRGSLNPERFPGGSDKRKTS